MPKRPSLPENVNKVEPPVSNGVRLLARTVPGYALDEGRMLPLELLNFNPNQFRQTFDEDTIRELAASIAEQGLVEPLIVRPHDGGYQIVAGARRLSALQLLRNESNPRALTMVPALLRDMDDSSVALAMAVENIQREDLSIAEEAVMYERLITALGLDPDRANGELARRLGISDDRVWRARRLARYPGLLQAVVDEQLTMRDALGEIKRSESADNPEPRREAQPVPPSMEQVAGPPAQIVEQTSGSPHGAESSTKVESSAPPIFTTQSVAGHERRVPAKVWQPFYSATSGLERLINQSPALLVRDLAEKDREDITARALKAREQLELLLTLLGRAGETNRPA